MVAVKLTLAVLAVVVGVAMATAPPTPCAGAQDAGFYCDHNQFATKYYWCAYPFSNSYIPGWFDCAPGTYCTVAGSHTDNPCTPVPPADACPNDPAKLAPGVCGCGVADTDSDGDGTADCNDACPSDAGKVAPGVCGCGVADVNTDGDAKFDCEETCDNDANKTAPGDCGCGVADTDANSNSVSDCLEPCPNPADACCGLNNGFTCQGTLNTGMYVECSAPFFVGQRACAPGTTCKAGGFTTQNPCA